MLELFDQYVSEALDSMPEQFKQALENVSVVIEDFPTPYQAQKMRLKHRWQLFGLYEGVPLPQRNHAYAGVLPDKITLFRAPLIGFAKDAEHLKRLVANVVWHEFAHYFGMNEEEVRAAERRRGVSYF